jgi:hypothetical protein
MSQTPTAATQAHINEEAPRALLLRNRSAFSKVANITKDNLELMEQVENTMEQTYVMACALTQIKKALTDEIMAPIMALQGSRLGFKADKVYGLEVVRNVTAEALLAGLRMTGNEINIIADNLYPAQAGLERLVSERVDAGTYVDHQPELPVVSNGKWVCEYAATYTFRGKTETARRKFSGRHFVNATSDDQIIGKCRRKMLLEIHRRITGMALGDADEANLDTMRNVTPAKAQQPAVASGGILAATGQPAAQDAQPEPNEREDHIRAMRSQMAELGVSEDRLMAQARAIGSVPEGIDELWALPTDTLRKLALAIPALSTATRK